MSIRSGNILAALAVAILAFFGGYSIAPKIAKVPATDIPTGSSVIPVSIIAMYEDASTSPSVNVEYPQFPSLSADFNADIASATMSRFNHPRTGRGQFGRSGRDFK